MLMNPQIATITTAKNRKDSHHDMWITTIPSRLR